ncbi:MAG: hypothetical protein AB7V08_08195 [Elusimicrobiales bacterium]
MPNISNKRNELLSDAGLLNAKDSGLYDSGVQIDNAAEAFAKEKAALQAEINQYNQKCSGQPASNYCTNWYNKLSAKLSDYNRRVEIHNQNVKAWRIDVQNLKSIVDSWRSKVQEWEAIILDFIEDAKALLANPDTGTCPPHPGSATSSDASCPARSPAFPVQRGS